MMPRPALVVGLTAAISIAAAWRLLALIGGPAPPDPVASSVLRGSVPVVVAPGPYMAASWSRPLFSTTDGAANSAALKTKPVNTAAKPHMPRLIGVLTQGTDRIAVIDINGQLKRVRQNDTVGEWRLVRVDPRTVVVRLQDVTHTLSLDQPVSGERSAPGER